MSEQPQVPAAGGVSESEAISDTTSFGTTIAPGSTSFDMSMINDLGSKMKTTYVASGDTETEPEGEAGIKDQFKEKIHEKITSYIGDIETQITNFETAYSTMDTGFEGTDLQAGIQKLIENLKTEMTAYKDALSNAEKQLIEMVEEKFGEADDTISGNISTHAQNLQAPAAEAPTGPPPQASEV